MTKMITIEYEYTVFHEGTTEIPADLYDKATNHGDKYDNLALTFSDIDGHIEIYDLSLIHI